MGTRVGLDNPAIKEVLLGGSLDELLQLLQVALPDAAHHKLAANE